MTTGKPSALKLRIISGFVLGPLTALAIIAGGPYFMALLAVAFFIALREWKNLAMNAPDRRYLTLVGGVVYLILCFMSYIWLRFYFPQGAWMALSVVVAIWASDTGAYFTGTRFGGPKMAPKISPNKTWAGLGGAVFFSGLTMVILMTQREFFSRWMDTGSGEIIFPGVFLIGCLLGLAGQAGDLLVSVFKRRAKIKDSGGLIPGHGGLLDRIDSLLLAAPVFTLILWLP